MRIFGESEGMVGAAEGGLQVAQGGVCGQELRMLDGVRATAGEVALGEDPPALNDGEGEAPQPVRDQRGGSEQGLRGELLDRLFGERSARETGQHAAVYAAALGFAGRGSCLGVEAIARVAVQRTNRVPIDAGCDSCLGVRLGRDGASTVWKRIRRRVGAAPNPPAAA